MSTRGYAKWNPQAEAIHWVRSTLQVLDQYRDYWPLSVRQIFYRLVADHGYEKTEAAYGKLTGILSRARRAGYLDWDAIRDGGLGRTVRPTYYADQADFEQTVRYSAENLQLDRQRGQDAVIELWCEAGGMVPILEGIAKPYSCQVNTGGGYDSVTAKHNLAVRARDRAREGLKTVILHVGDFDGSGEDMCQVLREDALQMVITQVLRGAYTCVKGDDPDGWREAPWVWLEGALMKEDSPHWDQAVYWAMDFFEVERVALTGDQVIDRNVETAPPKKTDSRTAAFVERNAWVADELGTEQISAQLEALTPPELEELISGAIEARLDMDVYQGVLDEEAGVRADLLRRLDR